MTKHHVEVPPKAHDTGGKFGRFVDIIAALRSEDGCPWDRKQTHASIARNMVEEAYEAVQAIEDDDPDDMAEELGDVLLEVVLQAQIGRDQGEFDIDDVIDGICDKMVRRHPHVFGDEASFEAAGLTQEERRQIAEVRTPDDVSFLWDYIKVREKRQKAQAKAEKAAAAGRELPQRSILDDVSRSLPALMQAQDISRKAVARGFEWDTREDVWAKVREESKEYDYAVAHASQPGQDPEMEFGDLLFTLVNVARKDGIDAENALRKSCEKFRLRWSMMETYASQDGKAIDSYGIDGLDALWNRAKQQLGE